MKISNSIFLHKIKSYRKLITNDIIDKFLIITLLSYLLLFLFIMTNFYMYLFRSKVIYEYVYISHLIIIVSCYVVYKK